MLDTRKSLRYGVEGVIGRSDVEDVRPPMEARAAFPIALLLAVTWLFLCAVGISFQYSYWFDELFSVSLSNQSLEHQFEIYLKDVHPPLYQLTLSAWMFVFGDTEISTRALSSIFVVLGLSAFLYLKRFKPDVFVSIACVFVLSNFLVHFYAQETRSYGMLFCFSAWAMVMFVLNENKYLFIVLMFLSLIHFFGTLLACLISLWLLFEYRSDVKRVIASLMVFGVAAIWPVIWFVSGEARRNIGGSFWIETSPNASVIDAFTATIPTAFRFLDVAAVFLGIGDTIYAGLFVTASILLAALIWFSSRDLGEFEMMTLIKSLYVLVAATGAVYLISWHTPVSTLRNFIILVPVGALLFACVTVGLVGSVGWIRNATSVGLIAFVLASLALTLYSLQTKLIPIQDWKASAEKIAVLQEAQESRIFAVKLFDKYSIVQFDRLQYGFYLTKYGLDFEVMSVSELPSLTSGDIIYFGHLDVSESDSGCTNQISELYQNQQVDFNFVATGRSCSTGFLEIR